MNTITKWAKTGLLLLGLCGLSMCGAKTPEVACQEGSKAYCDYAARCLPPQLKALYGDSATCESRLYLSCMESFAPGSTATGESLSTCTKAIAALSCDGAIDSQAACNPTPGTLTNGSPCGSDYQCQSTYCKLTSNGSGMTSTCGACTQRAKVGDSCDATECEFGLGCVSQGTGPSKCVTPAAEGSQCSSNAACQSGLICSNNLCAKPTYLGPGASCDPNKAPSCDFRQGLYCNNSKICEAVKYANNGEACGSMQNGTLTLCQGGAACIQMGGILGSRTCVAPAKDGQPCNSATGPGCLSPATCVNNVCTVPSAAACK